MKLRFDLRFFPSLQEIDKKDNRELRHRNEERLGNLKKNGTLTESEPKRLNDIEPIAGGLIKVDWNKVNKPVYTQQYGRIDRNGEV